MRERERESGREAAKVTQTVVHNKVQRKTAAEKLKRCQRARVVHSRPQWSPSIGVKWIAVRFRKSPARLPACLPACLAGSVRDDDKELLLFVVVIVENVSPSAIHIPTG